jgi:phosphatidylserine/phosphatidylglycerophosphate/cardiolipin synthase-like enzyme
MESPEHGALADVAASALAFQFFDEVSFGPALQADIRDATSSIVIVSAFITSTRVETFLSLLARKVAEQVRVVVIIPPSHQNGSIHHDSYRKACTALSSIGVKVVERRDIHTKLVCLDEETVWHGSLNPLSYTGNRREIMTRTVSKVAARKVSDGFPAFARPQSHDEQQPSFVAKVV